MTSLCFNDFELSYEQKNDLFPVELPAQDKGTQVHHVPASN